VNSRSTRLSHRGVVVEFAEFALRRVKPAGDLAVGILGVALGRRGVTEQLRRRVELLVDLQPGDEPQLLVVLGGRPYSLRSTAAGRD